MVVPVALLVFASGCSSAPGESSESSASGLSMTMAQAVADDGPPPACTYAPGNQIVVNPSAGCSPYGDWSQGEFCVSGSDPHHLQWQGGFGCAVGSATYNYCVQTHGAPTIVNEVCVHVQQSCTRQGGGVVIAPVPAPACDGGNGAQVCSCCTCGSCSRH